MASFAEYTKKKRKLLPDKGVSFTDYTKSVLGRDDIEAPTYKTYNVTDDDIAPVKTTTSKDTDERKWFEKGAFEDGYQFGDVARTIISTTTDTAENVYAGVIGMGEKVVDAGAYVVQGSLGTGLKIGKTILKTGLGLGGLSEAATRAIKGEDVSLKETGEILRKWTEPGDEYIENVEETAEKGFKDFIAKDLYDEKKVASYLTGRAFKEPVKDFYTGLGMDEDVFEDLYIADDKNSILGDKTESLAQSGGQLLATAGLQAVGVPWWITTGVTSFGSEVDEAYNEGATFAEAGISAAITAGAEILTEKISGGIKFGGKALGDVVTDGFLRNISNKTIRTLSKLGIDAAGEGFEEILSGVMSAVGQKLTYADEKEFNELFSFEEAWESFIGGVVLGGGFSGADAVQSKAKGVDPTTKLTENEETVVNKVYEDRIKEAEKDGKALTAFKKQKIYDDILEEMEKGYISTDTIEEVLGGETYKTYKNAFDNEEALQNEFNELNKMKQGEMTGEQIDRRAELKEQLADLKAKTNTADMKTKLGEEVFSLVKDSKLAESYNEKARRGQAFEADLSQYDEKYQGTIKKAVESGILNNTRRTHEMVDFIAKISADKGVLFDFTDNEKLKNSSFAVEGKTVNGFVDENGNVVLNIESAKSLNSTAGHEITHILEGTELYQPFADYITEYARTKGEYDSRLAALNKLYEGVYKGEDFDTKVQKELVADLVGDYIFTDKDFVRKLSTENRNVFQKIYDEIKYLCKVATAGSKEARELEKVKKTFAEVYRESGNTNKSAQTDTNTDKTYSLSVDSEGKQLSKEQSEFFKDSKMRDDNGNLKVMYHGSQDAGFHIFDANMSDDETSFFFVDRNDVAASYSGTTETYEAQTIRTAEDMNKFLEKIGYDSYEAVEKNGKFELLENGEHITTKDTAQEIYEEFCWYEGVGEGDANYKVYLNLKNPLVVDAKGRNWNNVSREFSQEVADRYNSLTAEEKSALTNLAEWEDFQIFRDEILSVLEQKSIAPVGEDKMHLDSAIDKLGGNNINISNLFSIASDNFSAESIQEFAVKQMNTRDYAKRAKEQGYDGVIFKNIHDNGGYSNGSEGASTVAIAFESNQIKSVANEKPTSDPDIRYSLSTDSQGRELSKEQQNYFKDSKAVDENGSLKFVYHGTRKADFTEFKRNINYFTDNREMADSYSPNGEMYEGYVNITKPYEIDAAGEKWSSIPIDEATKQFLQEYGASVFKERGKWRTTPADIASAIEEAVDNGDFDYDGIIIKNIDDTGSYYKGEEKHLGTDYIVFNSNQFKNADNVSPTESRDIRYSLSEADNTYLSAVESGDTETVNRLVEDAAEKAMPNSKVRDENGKLRLVYRGRVSDFNVFDRKFSQIEGDFGKGFYFTSNEYDVDENYANEEGADLKNRIARYAERLEYEDEYADLSYEEREQKAREKFITSEPNTITAYLNMENPVYITPNEKGTFLDFNEVYDEELDEYGEPEGLLIDFVEALENNASDFETFGDVDFSFLYEEAYDGGILASDAVGMIKRRIVDEVTDENGDLAINEVIRLAFEDIGFDGIIDTSVYYKFRNMNGIDSGTTHYIVFNSNQIKSADLTTYDDKGNVIPLSERFNLNNEDIRYSLSEKGKPLTKYGNFNIYGKDVKLEKPTEAVEDIAPVMEDTPITEEEAIAQASENLETLDDADAPPEVEAPYTEYSDTTRLDNETLKNISKSLKDVLYLNRREAQIIKDVVQKYSTSEMPDKAELFWEIKEQFGERTYDEPIQEVEEIRDFLRGYKIKISDNIKGDIPDFNSFRRSLFNKVNIRKDGIPVDVAYMELREMFPSFFPGDLINSTDQFMRIAEVANMKKTNDIPYYLGDETIQEAVDIITDEVGKYKENTARIEAEDMARESLEDIAPLRADQVVNRAKSQDNAPRERIDTVEYRQSKKLQALEQELADNKQLLSESVSDYQNRIARLVEEYESLTDFNSRKANDIIRKVARLERLKTNVEADYSKRISGLETRIEEAKQNVKTDRVAEVLTEEPTVEKKKSGVWQKFKGSFLDKGAVFEDLSLKTKNRKLQAKYNFLHYSEGIAQRLIGKGTNGVKALNDIRAEVEKTGKTEDFYKYLYHKHNIDRMNLEDRYEDVENKPVFGDFVTSEVSQGIVNKIEAENPDFKAYADDVYTYMNYLRNQLVEKGVISQETADLWAEMYPHYVPIRRVGDNGVNINVALDTNKTGVNAPVKRATGGNSDILPLFDTMAMRTLQTFKAAAKNNFGVELKNTLGTTIEKAPTDIDGIIDSVDSHESLLQEGKNGQAPTFTVFENGERVTFEITEEMYDALKPTSKGLAYTNKVANTISNLHRNVLTQFNPTFMLTNAVKDAQDVLMNSQHPAKTYANFPQAVVEMISGKGQYYAEYIANGGEQNTYFEKDSNTFAKEKGTLRKIVGFPLDAISKANDFFEKIPRVAEYIASRKNGASVEVSMLDAARVTTNFAAGGDVTKFLNRNGATFLNASVQGAMQQVRNIREAKANGLKGWVGLATKTALAGLPAILLNGLLWDDDEEYAELSDYVKDNYYIVAKTEDGKFIRIPKGRAVAVIQEAFEQIGNAITGDDEVDFANFFELVMNNIAPNNPIENNILAPIMQVANNKAWYGGDLVPTRLQDLPEAEQFDESTDELSKWLGEKLNFSPYKINYLLNQYSGGLGDVVLPMLTPEAESGDNSIEGNLLAPLKDKFTTDSVMNNQNVSDFYDKVDELTVNANSSKATDEDILKQKYMNSINSELGELYQQKREIQNSSLPDDVKYERVRNIQEQINSLARESLNTYEDVRIQGKYATVGDTHFRWYEPGEESSAEAGWQKISGKQLEKQEEVTNGLGISASEYWSNKEEYDYAYEYPENYAVAKAVGGYNAYKTYTSELYDIKADKDENGKSISGSRKEKVADYINNLDIDYYEKIILFKNEYNADDTYNYEIIDYLNGREDISYAEMESILKKLGFTVTSDGTIRW